MIRCRSQSSVWTVRARALWGAVLVCLYCGSSSCAWAEPAAASDVQAGRAAALFQKGLQLAAAGNTDAAVETFSQLTRDYPRLWQPYAQLGALYVRKGELTKAIVPLQTALRLESNVPALQEQLDDLRKDATRATQSSKDVGSR